MTDVCVIYGAKSSEDTHGSIPTQLDDSRRLAEREGLEVAAEHSDEAASAYSGDRGGGLAAAMTDCERLSAEHGACALIVQHSDRLARGDAKKARHLIEIVVWAIKHDVRLLSVQDPEILAGGDLQLLLGAIGGMRNHQDSKRKSLAVKDGLRRRVTERKQFVGGRRPYGYRWTAVLDSAGQPQTVKGRIVKRLEIDPAEAVVVRRIFADYLRDVPQARIASDLNEAGVATLTGTQWYATTVAGMLRNPLLCGRVVLGGEDFPGEHDPIITEQIWLEAQRLRAARSARGRPRGRRTVGRHVLTEGMLRCTCGRAMSPITKDQGRYEVYTCISRLHQSTERCPQKPIKRAVIDETILRYFERVALDVESTRQTIVEQASRKLEEADALRQHAEQELARVESALTRIEGDYIAGKIDGAGWSHFKARLNSEREAAIAEAEQHDRHREVIAQEIAEFDAEATIAEGLAALRQQVTGQVRSSCRAGLDTLRVTLKQVFAGFELCSPAAPFGSGSLRGDGVLWSQNPSVEDNENIMAAGDGYQLLPVVRSQAVDIGPDASYRDGFPAVARASLPFRDNFHSRLAAW